MEKYREEGVNFLKNAFSSVKYLEDVTKLSQYHKIIDEIEVRMSIHFLFFMRFCLENTDFTFLKFFFGLVSRLRGR